MSNIVFGRFSVSHQFLVKVLEPGIDDKKSVPVILLWDKRFAAIKFAYIIQ